MSRRARSGFTVVELLVVITIIAMLAGLLLPAILSSRNAARGTECMNKCREIGHAVQSFAMKKQRFPGLVTAHPADADTPVGWIVPLLPYLDRTDLYELVGTDLAATIGYDGTIATKPAYAVQLAILICPSEQPPADNDPVSSYVANAGFLDVQRTQSSDPPRDVQANGVFLDLYNEPREPTTDLAYVSSNDGAATTIMVSEKPLVSNNGETASRWILPASLLGTASHTGTVAEGLMGMLWANQANSPYRDGVTIATTAPTMPTAANVARPLSYHQGGFNVTFCDGHAAFVSDEIDYHVYGRLMTPRGSSVSPAAAWQGVPLSDSDLKK